MKKSNRPLSDTERAEWDAIARTITPLAKPRRVPTPEPAARTPKTAMAPTPPSAIASAAAPARPAMPVRASKLPPVEPRVLRALKRGQLALDARLDLHGETQASAHRRLESFLTSARRRGQRVVLIVTGKGLPADAGSGNDSQRGVLRRMLPVWLAAEPFASWVLGLSPAGPAHGGGGAFYLALRRERQGS